MGKWQAEQRNLAGPDRSFGGCIWPDGKTLVILQQESDGRTAMVHFDRGQQQPRRLPQPTSAIMPSSQPPRPISDLTGPLTPPKLRLGHSCMHALSCIVMQLGMTSGSMHGRSQWNWFMQTPTVGWPAGQWQIPTARPQVLCQRGLRLLLVVQVGRD